MRNANASASVLSLLRVSSFWASVCEAGLSEGQRVAAWGVDVYLVACVGGVAGSSPFLVYSLCP